MLTPLPGNNYVFVSKGIRHQVRSACKEKKEALDLVLLFFYVVKKRSMHASYPMHLTRRVSIIMRFAHA